MPAFYRAPLLEFVSASDSTLTGLLSLAYARDGFQNQKSQQTLAWAQDVFRLRETLAEVVARSALAAGWMVLLEFNIPRKMRRIDVVLLAGDEIILLEQKSHAATAEDCLQAEEYALLLHYFHQPSARRKIVPVVVSPASRSQEHLRQRELPFLETAAFWIAPVCRVSWTGLADFLVASAHTAEDPINSEAWEHGEYRPVPAIIDAALSLQSGLNIREIAYSRAARHEVDQLTDFVRALVEDARDNNRHVACFVTGVPGSGKTLVGLNLAFSKRADLESIHFMSGNGPLVKVIQAVLARHQMKQNIRAVDAKIHAKTLIENVHVFARTYTEDYAARAPSNHVVIFDEAQRAWDRAQNYSKFKRDYSEPEMLLKIMERHEDWAVVIALVGGGQEINNGEAGLNEWGSSLAKAAKPWRVYASPEALEGGASVAGGKLIVDAETSFQVYAEPRLHLDVSVRSLKADSYARWVNHVVSGEASDALEVSKHSEFPVYLTRDLATLRRSLRNHSLGRSRAGLVASSQAARLRAEGLEPDSTFHGGYPWEHWYLAGAGDVRSSHQLEVFATEFEIQGLELDWVGLCWGGDYIWSRARGDWLIRAFRAGNSKWSEVKSAERRKFRRNAYRVLLTRARQGIVLYVPRGDEADQTRSPREFEETAQFLVECGAKRIEGDAPTLADEPLAEMAEGLFAGELRGMEEEATVEAHADFLGDDKPGMAREVKVRKGETTTEAGSLRE